MIELKSGKLIAIVDNDNSRDDYTHSLIYRCSECNEYIDGIYINLLEIKDIDVFIQKNRPHFNHYVFPNFIKCYNCGIWLFNPLNEE